MLTTAGLLGVLAACATAAPNLVESDWPRGVNVSFNVARQWLWRAGELATLGQRDGLPVYAYTWLVEDIEKKLSPPQPQQVMESNAFYTDVPGYRLRLYLYHTNASCLGVFLGVVRGEFDDQVSWPFANRYQLSGAGADAVPFACFDVAPSTDTNCTQAFARPSDTGGSCGTAQFITKETLMANKDKYLINGSLAIDVTIYLNV